MIKIASRTVFAALIGLGSLSFAPISAHSEDFSLEIGKNGPRLKVRPDCDPDDFDCDDRDGPPPSRRRICTEDKALDKADRLGIDRARIESAGRRTIQVRGRNEDGDRVYITFGRAPNCPVIG